MKQYCYTNSRAIFLPFRGKNSCSQNMELSKRGERFIRNFEIGTTNRCATNVQSAPANYKTLILKLFINDSLLKRRTVLDTTIILFGVMEKKIITVTVRYDTVFLIRSH